MESLYWRRLYLNYRTPLESYGDTSISITNTAQTQWAEQSSANIRCVDARFNFLLPVAAYLYSITGETFDSYGVALLGTIVLKLSDSAGVLR